MIKKEYLKSNMCFADFSGTRWVLLESHRPDEDFIDILDQGGVTERISVEDHYYLNKVIKYATDFKEAVEWLIGKEQEK